MKHEKFIDWEAKSRPITFLPKSGLHSAVVVFSLPRHLFVVFVLCIVGIFESLSTLFAN